MTIDAVKKKATVCNSLGLCLGASTVSLVHVALESDADGNLNQRVVNQWLFPHEGDPKRTLKKALQSIDMDVFDRVAATGRRFRHFVRLSAISEPEAVEYAYRFAKPTGVDCPAVVSAGGETFMVYVLDGSGRIANVLTGNKCASGTGEFLLQQLRRMDVTLEEAAKWAASEEPYHVSGRCSVFCKSDCTHATNKGIPRSKVTAGLCMMMANKILELLKKVERRHVMVTGGTTRNRMMVEYLGREIDGLIVPKEAPYFEALGAALWALDHEAAPFPGMDRLFKTEVNTFDALPPLSDFSSMVEFKQMQMGQPAAGDRCILGLDVGSTTTKAVLMRIADDAVLASVYLRTNGDPVGASRRCYAALLEQLQAVVAPEKIAIEGLGVCGSGRQIAGLHALTEGVINEIIAHAAAAVLFDSQVDTIFEIGGQDAKYTYITNAVPSDYAMNEACSAGTGSFLEESAFESLGVPMEKIAGIALAGRRPPNFNDQCAAFIASDIKNAIHEGIAHEDIVAGLVYSICMNYSNRVKGNRPVGEKVFMQGGVCYNRAVPLAMAALVGKPIIVPPEPGLMGAYGVALEVKHRIQSGLMESRRFDLQALKDREVRYKKPFTCRGGKEGCDRRCEVARIEVEGRTYPFGGACNRYYNLRQNVRYEVESLDLVRVRQKLIFDTYAGKPAGNRTDLPRVAISRSFLVGNLYPLYSTFFAELGFEPVLAETPSRAGIDQRNAAFCYPAELAHGFFHFLLQAEPRPNYIFLPHFRSVPVPRRVSSAYVCPLVQGEPYYLQATFREQLNRLKKAGTRVLGPLLDLRDGLSAAREPLVKTAQQMGIRRRQAEAAFQKALDRQHRCREEMIRIGQETLAGIESDPEKTAVVIFGRPYNAFADEAHMGIPHKLASRGVTVLPLDFLDLKDEHSKRHMYWGMGELILKAARQVKRHPQLFGTYITNFSCGPDSFVIGYFREIMGKKPSLTLELDSHTADAGLETRIEAFLDIVAAYRQLPAGQDLQKQPSGYRPARVRLGNEKAVVETSSGQVLPVTDPRVTVLFPSMGAIATDLLAAVFKARGFRAYAHPPADEAVLKIGRANTSCKECLPLILTTGILLNYAWHQKRDDEILVYFMATGSGPCRFGQYFIFMEDLIRRLQIPDVAMFSLTSDNSYAGLGNDFQLHGWWAIVISDLLEDIRSMILANAQDPAAAMAIFDEEVRQIREKIGKGEFPAIEHQLRSSSQRFGAIPMKLPPFAVPTINLTGEIFVRRDSLSRQQLVRKLADMGFATVCTPVAEWLHYSDYLVENNLGIRRLSKMERLGFLAKKKFMVSYEKRIKAALSASGLIHAEPIRVGDIIEHAAPFISRNLPGEAVLTVGGALTEVASHVCGVIAIGPFGCMPNRLSEAILTEVMNREDKLASEPSNSRLRAVLTEVESMPFLAVESDGSPFPQLINAKLEAFCLRARRLHRHMMANGKGKHQASAG